MHLGNWEFYLICDSSDSATVSADSWISFRYCFWESWCCCCSSYVFLQFIFISCWYASVLALNLESLLWWRWWSVFLLRICSWWNLVICCLKWNKTALRYWSFGEGGSFLVLHLGGWNTDGFIYLLFLVLSECRTTLFQLDRAYWLPHIEFQRIIHIMIPIWFLASPLL